MGVLLKLHGEVRWLVALVALVAIVRFTIGWIKQAEFKGLDRGLMATLTGLLDLNFVLGLILLFGLPGGLLPQRIEHASTMLLAIVAAHLSALWRRSGDSALKFRNHLLVTVAAVVLVATGVIRLRGGWTF